MLVGQGLQPRKSLGLPAQGEVGLHGILQGRQPEVFEPADLSLGEGLVGEAGQRRPSPEAEGMAQGGGGVARVDLQVGPPPPPEGLKLGGVQVVGSHLQGVAGAVGPQRPPTGGAPGRQRPAQLGDMHLQRPGAAPGRVTRPDLLQDAVGGHDLVGMDQQEGQQRPLLGRSRVDGASCRQHLQRSEDAELHAPSGPGRLPSAYAPAGVVSDR